jgi:hypothetical protein
MASLVPVKTCLSLPEALVVSSYLSGHGLITALNGYHHASAAWFVLFALDGVRISVLDRDVGRARELLADVASKDPSQEEPEAGRRHSAPTVFEVAVAAAALILSGLPLPLWIRRRYLHST